MSITVPDEVYKAASDVAKRTGANVEQLLVRALQAHFPPLEPELAAEFDAWERASDEDAAHLVEREGTH